MHRLKIVRTEHDPDPLIPWNGAPDTAPPHGLFISFGACGTRRAMIVRHGRVLVDMSYDPAVVTDDDLDAIYLNVMKQRRAG